MASLRFFIAFCLLIASVSSDHGDGPDMPEEGDIRLVMGRLSSEGRVEIYHDHTWGTVCGDHYWSMADAMVVCRQLGYINIHPVIDPSFYRGSGSDFQAIHLSLVECTGSEARLADCNMYWGENSCDHRYDVGVKCNPGGASDMTEEGTVRLVSGPGNHEGLVELYFNETWGKVCGDDWSEEDATVVCRQLGYTTFAWPPANGYFNGAWQPTGEEIHMTDVRCNGSEALLIDCPSTPPEEYHWCNTASVVCFTGNISAEVPDGSVRLVDGWTSNEGRLEIYHYNAWGTVRFDLWSVEDATVVCRQLGYFASLWVPFPSYFGPGSSSQPMYLEEVRCNGSEARLTDCDTSPWVVDRSRFSEDDVGVICQTGNYREGDVRLIHGTSWNEGRVEIFFDNTWGTICEDQWDMYDATVVCQQLGFGYGIVADRLQFGEAYASQPIHMSTVECTGFETALISCPHSRLDDWCTHENDVGVICSGEYDALEGMVRLVGGLNDSEGRVEIHHDHKWRTICDSYWDVVDASVVCRQLGYLRASSAPRSSFFGPGDYQHSHIANVQCQDDVTALRFCDFTTIDDDYFRCNNWSIAGAICANTEAMTGDIRLVDGPDTEGQGRVEIFYEGEWGTVCNNYWGKPESRVVCRQMGYNGSYESGFYGEGIGPIHMTFIDCTGYESSLMECDHSSWYYCSHAQDVGVRCTFESGSEGMVRLVGGSSDSEGRVEIYLDNEWGNVCDSYWDVVDASVVCRQLGYLRASSAPRSSFFGPGDYQRTHITDVRCQDWDTALKYCDHTPVMWGCDVDSLAGAVCTNEEAMTGDIRLVDGPHYEGDGRVEIFYEGEWGTVCDDYWGEPESRVVCRQLGYNGSVDWGFFGEGNGPIHLDDVSCTGNESSLMECRHEGWGNNNCRHSEDVGVFCSIIRPSSEPVSESSMAGWAIALSVIASLVGFALLVCCVSVLCTAQKAVVTETAGYPTMTGVQPVASPAASPAVYTMEAIPQPPPSYDQVVKDEDPTSLGTDSEVGASASHSS